MCSKYPKYMQYVQFQAWKFVWSKHKHKWIHVNFRLKSALRPASVRCSWSRIHLTMWWVNRYTYGLCFLTRDFEANPLWLHNDPDVEKVQRMAASHDWQGGYDDTVCYFDLPSCLQNGRLSTWKEVQRLMNWSAQQHSCALFPSSSVQSLHLCPEIHNFQQLWWVQKRSTLSDLAELDLAGLL